MNAHVKPTPLSSRLSAVRPSPTIAITRLANELRRAGRDVIGLSQGEPDFDTPEHVKEAATGRHRRRRRRNTPMSMARPSSSGRSSPSSGSENGLTYDVAQISVGTGGKQVIYNALFATLDAGRRSHHPRALLGILSGHGACWPAARRSSSPAARPTASSSPPTRSRAAITPRTKWLVLNSPSNPTGAGYSARGAEGARRGAARASARAGADRRHVRAHPLRRLGVRHDRRGRADACSTAC